MARLPTATRESVPEAQKEVFDEMVGRSCRFVWGNCDFPDAGIYAYLQTVGLTPPDDVPLRLEFGSKRFAVFHGHERAAAHMEALDDVDYVVHGHSHQRRDERVGAVRIINPGAVHRASPLTVAVLDVETDELTFHEVAKR